MVDFNQFLDFEKPVVEVEEELARMRAQVTAGDLSKAAEVEKLEDSPHEGQRRRYIAI